LRSLRKSRSRAKFGGEVTIRFHTGTISGLSTSLVPHAIRASERRRAWRREQAYRREHHADGEQNS
jgi:hypothetical protein